MVRHPARANRIVKEDMGKDQRKRPGWLKLIVGNLAVLAGLLLVILGVGEAYFRFFFDGTDSFGLTRVTDKRKVRRDLADFFCTVAEGVKGKRAVQYKLVDETAPKSKWADPLSSSAFPGGPISLISLTGATCVPAKAQKAHLG